MLICQIFEEIGKWRAVSEAGREGAKRHFILNWGIKNRPK
jgi:hypothetical protein